MNLDLFYESLNFRDILAYLIPGSFSFFGLRLIANKLYPQLSKDLHDCTLSFDLWMYVLVIILLSYVLGHIVTPITMLLQVLFEKLFEQISRAKEDTTAQQILSEDCPSNAPAVVRQIRGVITQYLGSSEDETFKKDNTSLVYRTIAKYVHHESEILWGYYIGRRQTLCSFCYNIGTSFLILVLSFCISRPSGLDYLAQLMPLVLILFIIAVLFFWRGFDLQRKARPKTEIFQLFLVLREAEQHRGQERARKTPGQRC